MNSPEIVIVVPVWDTDGAFRYFTDQSYCTIRFISSLQLCLGNWLCVIVDNGSDSQSTVEFLDSISDPRFHVIRNASNVGYGAAANQGIAYGIERGAKYVIVSNNDVEWSDDNWIENGFVSHLRENPKRIVGARYLPDNNMTKFDLRAPIPYLEGYLFACTVEAWQDIGGFDPNFIAYMEDVDFCYRAATKGYELYQSPQFVWEPEGGLVSGRAKSVLVHHLGGRTGYNRADFNYPQITRESVLYFQNKHGFQTNTVGA